MAASLTSKAPTHHHRASCSTTRRASASTSATTFYPSPPPSSPSTTTPLPSPSSSPGPTTDIKFIFNLSTGKASQISIDHRTGKRTTKWVRTFAPPRQPQCQPQRHQPMKPQNHPLSPKSTGTVSKRSIIYVQILKRRRHETTKSSQLAQIARLEAQIREMELELKHR